MTRLLVETGREGAPGAAGCRAVVALVEGTERRGVLTKRGALFFVDWFPSAWIA
jgi:hypothetical protein